MFPMLKQTARAAYRTDHNSLSLSALHEFAGGLKDHTEELAEESLSDFATARLLQQIMLAHAHQGGAHDHYIRPPRPCPLYARSRSAEPGVRDGRAEATHDAGEKVARREQMEREMTRTTHVLHEKEGKDVPPALGNEDPGVKRGRSTTPVLVTIADDLGARKLLVPEVWAARGDGRARSASPSFWRHKDAVTEGRIVR